MDNTYLLKGLAVGFVLCAPLGPVGIVCIRRTLIDGRLAGFFAILGAAVADAFYGLLAGLGVSVLAGLLDEARFWLQLFGALVLVAFGVRLFAASSSERISRSPARSSAHALLETLSLMLSNPLPILAISAVLSAFSGGRVAMGLRDLPLFALGIFLGSLAWSPILAGAASLAGPALQGERLPLFNRLCGAAIFSCGLYLGLAPLLVRSM